MESTRIESLLEDGWHLLGRLHHLISDSSPRELSAEALANSIRDLQSFWNKADGLTLRRIARNCLVLELFLDRLGKQQIPFTELNRQELMRGFDSLRTLLLGFEAMGTEPSFPDLALLQRLEWQTLQSTWSGTTGATIENSTVSDDESDSSPRSIEDHSSIPVHRRLPAPPQWIRIAYDASRVESELPLFDDGSDTDQAPVFSTDSDAYRHVLVIDESLFYRHLFQTVLQSVGYQATTMEGHLDQLAAIAAGAQCSYDVIVVSPPLTNQAAEFIEQIRSKFNLRVIGMRSSDDVPFTPLDVDACVAKTDPRKLLSLFERLRPPQAAESLLLTA